MRQLAAKKPYKPKAINKPSPHSIVHGLDKPGVFTTVSKLSPLSKIGRGEIHAGMQPMLR